MSFFRDATATSATRVATILIGLATSIVLARFLGPDGRGIYAVAMVLPGVLVTILGLGLGSSAVYNIAGSRHSKGEVLGSCLLIAAPIAVLGLAGGVAGVVSYGPIVLPGYPHWPLITALLLVPINLFFQIFQQTLLADQNVGGYNTSVLVQAGLKMGALAVALILLSMQVSGAIWAVVTANAATLGATTVGLFRGLRFSDLRPSKACISEVLRYGLESHVGNVVGFLNARLDILLLGFLSTSTDVGFYSVSAEVAEQMWIVSFAASLVLFPRVASNRGEGEPDITPQVTRVVLLISGILAVGMAVVAPLAIPWIFSEAFQGSVNPLLWLLPGALAFAVARVLAADIAGRGRPLINSLIGGVGLLTNVAFNFLLIPLFGASGAGMASTISYSSVLVGRIFVYRRISDVRLGELLIPKRQDVTVILSWLKR